ncbi:MAG: 50S ribosomal protein L29 [Ktedonobacterales bacterium]
MSKLSERRREIRSLSESEAQRELAELRRKLFELRLQRERGEVKDNRQFPKVRADIARLMHHMGELRHAAALAAEGVLDTVDQGVAEGEEA